MSNTEAADTNSNGGDGELKVSPYDAKFFAVIFKHLPQKLEIDWDKFAEEMGLKDGSIAKVRLRQIRKKLGLVDTAGTGNAAATGDAATTPTKASASKATKPKNAANKVTKARKPRKPAKEKQPKNAVEAAADAIHHEAKAANPEDDEHVQDGEV